MLAHVQTQIEQEIDLEHDNKMPSLTNVQESPRMVKRSSSFNRSESTMEFRRAAPRPPLHRMNSEVNSGPQSLNDYRYQNGRNGDYNHNGDIDYRHRNGDIRQQNGDRSSQDSQNLNGNFKGSQGSLEKKSIGEMGSQSSFQSLRMERHSVLSLQEQKRGSTSSLNGRSKTATLPRGYGSSKEKNWEEYWAQ